jgi:formate dehydrogenase assembly factor FdhD
VKLDIDNEIIIDVVREAAYGSYNLRAQSAENTYERHKSTRTTYGVCASAQTEKEQTPPTPERQMTTTTTTMLELPQHLRHLASALASLTAHTPAPGHLARKRAQSRPAARTLAPVVLVVTMHE